ncbi:MAG: class I SAM-dependent methyltransferase [Candidatus Scalinduaceae bacterium]
MSITPSNRFPSSLGHISKGYYTCPSCGSLDPVIFYEQEAIPIDSCRLLSNSVEAKGFPRGSLRLGFCKTCAFIWNTGFDPLVQDCSASYEETQEFSPRFQEFTRKIARHLIKKYQLYGKSILEIGCGQGEFLELMCQLGDNCGVGIDQNFVERQTGSEANQRITFIRDYFSERYGYMIGNFVICRHMLEHTQPVRDFLAVLRRSLGDRSDATVFFEVPDMKNILRGGAFWDIYYEHCSYFTCGSLARLLRSVGFEVLDLVLDFDDRYILLECRSSSTINHAPFELEETPAEAVQAVEKFQSNFREKLAEWRKILEPIRNKKKRAVLWGSGSKGAAFLNALEIGDEIEYIVNINPHQQGRYVVGTGQQIVPPEFLQEYKPDLIVSLNQTYLREITQRVEAMGVVADILAV